LHVPAKPCGDVMLGACVAPTVVASPCERGRARDLGDGTCATTRETRDLARAAGVYVDENDVIDCEAKGDELVSSARIGRIGCITRDAPRAPCPVRTVRVADSCSPLDRAGTVDVASWSRAASSEACTLLLRSPLALASPEPTLTVELDATVPDNDLSQGFVRLRTRPDVPAEDLARVTARLDDALRRLGAREPSKNPLAASASDVSAAATCRTSSRRPISVP
jgi:hypothetical protein